LNNVNATACDDRGWIVSSKSNGGGMCVQVKFAEQGTIMVRDSKDRRATSPIINMPSRGWVSLLTNISRETA
jgi:hypothetical protein